MLAGRWYEDLHEDLQPWAEDCTMCQEIKKSRSPEVISSEHVPHQDKLASCYTIYGHDDDKFPLGDDGHDVSSQCSHAL